MVRKIEKWDEVVKALDLDLGKTINMVKVSEVGATARIDARHMDKINSYEGLPTIFKDAGVFVVPVSNTEWAIIKGKGFEPVTPPGNTMEFQSGMTFLPAALRVGMSESQRIDYALSSGLVGHVVKQQPLWPGFRNKKFSPNISFRVDGSKTLEAGSVQVDFDACYETATQMIHFEAKTGRKWPTSFNIRQLYFPYRCLRTWVPEKESREFLFFYNSSADTYNFWEYYFKDHEDYESIKVRSSESYRILPPLSPRSLRDANVPISARALIPNQADVVAKIEAFPFYVSQGFKDRYALARLFGFEPRQSDYYGQAAEALGLVELRDGIYYLTELGKKFIRLSEPERQETLCERISAVPLIRGIMTKVNAGFTLSYTDVQELVQDELDKHSKRRKGGRSPSMGKRRAQTAVAWFRWLDHKTGEYIVGPDHSISKGTK